MILKTFAKKVWSNCMICQNASEYLATAPPYNVPLLLLAGITGKTGHLLSSLLLPPPHHTSPSPSPLKHPLPPAYIQQFSPSCARPPCFSFPPPPPPPQFQSAPPSYCWRWQESNKAHKCLTYWPASLALQLLILLLCHPNYQNKW